MDCNEHFIVEHAAQPRIQRTRTCWSKSASGPGQKAPPTSTTIGVDRALTAREAHRKPAFCASNGRSAAFSLKWVPLRSADGRFPAGYAAASVTG